MQRLSVRIDEEGGKKATHELEKATQGLSKLSKIINENHIKWVLLVSLIQD